jgi:hypothetical protein
MHTEPSLEIIDTIFTSLKDNKDVLTLITTPIHEGMLPIDMLHCGRDKIPHDAILHLQSHWYDRDQRASSAPASFSRTLARIHGLKGEDADKIL